MAADRYQLSDEDNERIFRRDIAPRIFSGALSSTQPVLVIFGGQPGSGKSAAMEVAVQELQHLGGCAEIIGDDLRPFHPAHVSLMRADDMTAAFYTDRDSARWVEKSLAYARNLQVNVVVEGTFRNPDVVARTMTDFRMAGYAVDARVLAVNGHFSRQGIFQRYEAQKADRGYGRMTTEISHTAAYEGMPTTLKRVEDEKLADRVTLYKRGVVPIYLNEISNGQWRRPACATELLTRERARPLTMQESASLLDDYRKLEAALTMRSASPYELDRIHDLLGLAKKMHMAAVYRHCGPAEGAAIYPELASAYNSTKAISRDILNHPVALRLSLQQAVDDRIARAIEAGQHSQIMSYDLGELAKQLDSQSIPALQRSK